MVKKSLNSLYEVLDRNQVIGEKATNVCAYAFFDCGATKKRVSRELSYIKKLVGMPVDLKLILTEGVHPESFNDPELREIAREAKSAGIRYTMKTTYQGNKYNNKSVADMASIILNQAYQSSLYSKDEPFIGMIVYKGNNSHYLERV